MSRPKARFALLAALALLCAGLAAGVSGPSASGQEADAPAITQVDTSSSVVPTNGWSGHGPTAAESAPEATTNDGVEGLPAGAETVIGPDGRVKVNNTTSAINRRIGQIEFFQSGGANPGNYICTGWLIDDNSILTSGHCVWDPPVSAGGGGGGIIESATWYPGRNGATDPFGGCAVNMIAAPFTQWETNGQPYWDYGVMNFPNPGPCASIGATLGTFGLMNVPNVNGLNNARATVQGYPGDKPDGTMWKMNGRIKKANKQFIFYPMDTFGGQSGSPIWWNRTGGSCTGPCGYGIHSYGTGFPGPGQTNNAGPRFTPFRLGQIADWIADNGG
jgi:glutamyl endopeptidase